MKITYGGRRRAGDSEELRDLGKGDTKELDETKLE